MTLLSGIRNLIGRKRELLTDDVAGLSEAGFGAAVEIEAKDPVPDFEHRPDEAHADHEVAQRLQEIDSRLGAVGAETRQLVKELNGHMASNSADIQRLIQKLDERIAQLLELVGEKSNQPADYDEAITAAVDAAAKRFIAAGVGTTEAVRRMQTKLDSVAEAGTLAGRQTEKLAFALDDIRERTTGLDEAITRIGQSIVQREGTFVEELRGARRTLMLFAYGCTFASLLALGIAIAAIIMA